MSSFALPCGRRMAYALSQPTTSKPVVLLSNSLCEDYTSWDRVVPVLETLGLRTLRYDQPGHGRSPAPAADQIAATTFETLADDVAQLLKHLHIGRLHAWVGVSMGGIKGVYFAARHPGVVQKLVVADAIAASPTVAGAPVDVFADRVAAAKTAGSMATDLDNVGRRWFGDAWLAAHPAEARRMRASMDTTTLEGLEACCAALSSPSFDLRPLYPSVGKGADAALIVVCEKDADLPVKMQDMRAAIETSLAASGKTTPVALEIVADAGHVPYVDGFDQFCEILKTFL
ncbi:zearalenone lactonase [Sporothrix brasiliensis 5110]|uniref:Zearalenone lactonase n=1 Tax=Sporothrix brasiliensis 5110 TaxID=1398154 RepID=A0A0C2IUP2_9PEZI|nr:zearalenone lactonase [Sporothrix brasiliensis 5110]KIH88697.1 zearalenone lactonase [Sporothrix brasiliensis 5110]